MCLCDLPQKGSETLKVDQGPTAHLLEAKWLPLGSLGVPMLPRGPTANSPGRQFRNREDKDLQQLVSEKSLPKSDGDKRKPVKPLPTQACIFQTESQQKRRVYLFVCLFAFHIST